MALHNVIGRRRRHDVIDAVPLLNPRHTGPSSHYVLKKLDGRSKNF